MIYRTEDEALPRVDRLREEAGVWPALIQVAGGWQLTYDPDLKLLDKHGYERDAS